jgi:hypothetical protein
MIFVWVVDELIRDDHFAAATFFHPRDSEVEAAKEAVAAKLEHGDVLVVPRVCMLSPVLPNDAVVLDLDFIALLRFQARALVQIFYDELLGGESRWDFDIGLSCADGPFGQEMGFSRRR